MPSVKRFSFLGLMVCIFLHNTKLLAQPAAGDSGIRVSAINSAVQHYQDYISFAAPLYAGPQYTDYSSKIQKGQPFYLNTNFNEGTILYNNMLYKKIPMKYDMVQNRVVIQDASGIFRLVPEYDKIAAFTIQDHMFVKLIKDSSNSSVPKNGFYEVLYTNRYLTILKKEKKEVIDDLSNSKTILERYITSSINFYVKKGNSYSSLNKKKDVLSLFKDKKNEVRQYIRKENIDFSADTEKAILSVVLYYESLMK